MSLHETVAAVVVGDKQTVGRDQFAGAAAAEEHDAVFHAVVVDAIDVIGRQMEAHLLHLRLVGAKVERDPHSPVRADEELHEKKNDKDE